MVGTVVVERPASTLIPPMVATDIGVFRPTTVMLTAPPICTDVALRAIVGAPSMVNVAFALSAGLIALNDTIYVPAAAVGTVKVSIVFANVPAVPTTGLPTVWIPEATTVLVVGLMKFTVEPVLVPGVKPAPPMPTVPTPDTLCAAARVMLGVAKIVSVVDATLPDASVTVMFSA